MYSKALLILVCLVSATAASLRTHMPRDGANLVKPGSATFDVPWPTFSTPQVALDITQGTINATTWKPAVQEQNFNDVLRSNWSTIGYRLSSDPESYAIVARHDGKHAVSWDVSGYPNFGDFALAWATTVTSFEFGVTPPKNVSAGLWKPLSRSGFDITWTNYCDNSMDLTANLTLTNGETSTQTATDSISLSIPSDATNITISIAENPGYVQTYYVDPNVKPWWLIQYGSGAQVPRVTSSYGVEFWFCPENGDDD